ncbi:hypothetical protein SAMN04488505_102225 [Chitinophaga rupis]|uniref:Uncharacterized protein n=1 Tax=Chitinophaga rupis TaxID=573321 RepID=A0A1H7Q1A7_9BACT|nr:hypothetical protein [Chitinophaga rupis]SEL41782.1 hypothetical protein SAMN04488505_102225 [Chitinophaga rupis]
MPATLDKRFIVTALSISVVYVFIIVLLSKLINKETAGVAGVALTAIATAIFKQYENLRFPDQRNVSLSLADKSAGSKESIWKVLVIGFTLTGIRILLQDVFDGVFPLLFPVPEDFKNLSGGHDIGIVNNGVILHYSKWETLITCFSFFIGSIIVTKAFRCPSYAVIVYGTLLAMCIHFYFESLSYYIYKDGAINNVIKDLEEYIYALLYAAFSFLGAFIVKRFKIVGIVATNKGEAEINVV